MTVRGLPGTSTEAEERLRRVEEAMDGRVMGPRLFAALGDGDGRRCQVIDVKYEPGLRCTLLYRAGDQLVRGDLLDDPIDGLDPARPVVAPGVRLSRFPDDPDLPGLAAAADAAALREALTDVLPGRGQMVRCRVGLLRYRPAKRATLAVEIRGLSSLPAQRLIVKSYHNGQKAAAVAAEAVLLDATVDPAAPLRFAPVRAHLPELSLVVQQHVAGVHLDDVLRAADDSSARALVRAAAALAALHRQPLVSRRSRDIHTELRRFDARGRRVAEVDAAIGGSLVALAARLAAASEDVPTGVVGLVHGDCKPSQFLLRGEGDVVLLDLDSCGQGDPAADVGTFLATLRQRAVRDVLARRRTPAGARHRDLLGGVFLRAYLDAIGGTSDGELRRRISWYEAVAFQRKALRAFARAPRSPMTGALVGCGHAALDRLEGLR
jgi:aminoglycoside phosphotransferase (APT) family kinase protein